MQEDAERRRGPRLARGKQLETTDGGGASGAPMTWLHQPPSNASLLLILAPAVAGLITGGYLLSAASANKAVAQSEARFVDRLSTTLAPLNSSVQGVSDRVTALAGRLETLPEYHATFLLCQTRTFEAASALEYARDLDQRAILPQGDGVVAIWTWTGKTKDSDPNEVRVGQQALTGADIRVARGTLDKIHEAYARAFSRASEAETLLGSLETTLRTRKASESFLRLVTSLKTNVSDVSTRASDGASRITQIKTAVR